jgi:hypothetical protein
MRPEVSYVDPHERRVGPGRPLNETHAVGELRYGAMSALGFTSDVNGR